MSLSAKPDSFLSRHGDTIHQSQPVPPPQNYYREQGRNLSVLNPLTKIPVAAWLINQPTPLTYDTNKHISNLLPVTFSDRIELNNVQSIYPS